MQFLFPVVFAASVSVLAAPTLASSTEKSITVAFRNIKLIVDGALFTPKDASGAIVEPFLYDNSVYLPARAVSEALGKTVTWDASTDSVFISSSPLPTNTPPEQTPTTEPDFRMEGNDIIRRIDFKIGYQNQPIDLPEIPSTGVKWQILTVDNPNDSKIITLANDEYINADPTADAVTHRFNFTIDRSVPIGPYSSICTVNFGQFLNGCEIGYKTICHCYIISGYGWD